MSKTRTYRRVCILSHETRRGTSYQLKWRDRSGRQRKRTVSVNNKSEARRKQRELEYEINNRPDALHRTLSEFIRQHTQARSRQVRPGTAKEERRILAYFMEAVGDLPLQELTSGHVEQFLEARLAGFHGHNPVSAASANKDLRTLKSAFNAAKRLGYIRENPCVGRRQFRVPERQMRTLTRDEAAKLLETASRWGHNWYRLIRLALSTGMRRNELMGLTWFDVDLDAGLVKVRNRPGSPTKSGRERRIPLKQGLIEEMRQWRQAAEARTNTDPRVQPVVVLAQSRPDFISEQFRRLVKEAGINKCTMHDLRRTFCTWLAMAGTPMPVLQELAGHASMETTRKHYIDIVPFEMSRAVDRLPSLGERSRSGPEVKDQHREQVPDRYH